MKKTLKSIGAEISSEEKKIDYFEIYRNAPPDKKRRSSLEELWREVKQARAEKLKKAS
jgi:hypothetical protein